MIRGDSLRALYVDEGLTGWEIADRLGVSGQTVYNRLHKAGISVRGRGTYQRPEDWQPPLPKIELDAETLESLYWGENLSLRDVADRLDVSVNTVKRRMAEHNIPRRPVYKSTRPHIYRNGPSKRGGRKPLEIDMDTVQWLYWGAGLSLRQIAGRLGVGHTTIRARMDKHGIRRRSRSEQCLLRHRRNEEGWGYHPAHFRAGWYRCADGNRVPYDSSWERRRYEQLDAMGVMWEGHPSVHIPYRYDGKDHIYHPDILVVDRGVVRLEEIKAQWEIREWAQTRYKLRAAQSYCRQRGWEFHLLVGENLQRKEVPPCQ